MKSTAIVSLALGIALASPLAASAQPYQHDWHGERMAIQGRIASVGRSDFTLENGATVFLRRGTVINPTGRRLHAGQWVSVDGQRSGDRNVTAAEVDVVHRR